MARFTVADCMEKIDNRFDMTLVAAVRARQITKGSNPSVNDIEHDKPTVLALREIADSQVTRDLLYKED